MPILEAIERLAVLGLHLGEGVVPVLVELLVLHDVGLFYFLAFSCLVVEHFLSAALEVLCLKLFNAVFGHFSLYKIFKQVLTDVFAFHFTLFSVFFKDGTIRLRWVMGGYIKSWIFSPLG